MSNVIEFPTRQIYRCRDCRDEISIPNPGAAVYCGCGAEMRPVQIQGHLREAADTIERLQKDVEWLKKRDEQQSDMIRIINPLWR